MPGEPVDSLTPRKAASEFTILEQATPSSSGSASDTNSGSMGVKRSVTIDDDESALPLTTSRLGNYQTFQQHSPTDESSPPKKQRVLSASCKEASSIDKLLAHLNQRKTANVSAFSTRAGSKDTTVSIDEASSSTGDRMSATEPEQESKNIQDEDNEISRLKKELELANSKIAAMDHELAQQRITSQSIDQVLRSPSEPNLKLREATDLLMNKLQQSPTQSALQLHGGARKMSGAMTGSPRPIDGFQAPWDDMGPGPLPYLNASANPPVSGWYPNMLSPWPGHEGRAGVGTPRVQNAPQPQRPANLRVDTFEANQQGYPGMVNQGFDSAFRPAAGSISRPDSAMGGQYYNGLSSYPASVPSTPLGFSPPMTPMQIQQMNQMMTQPNYSYRPRAIGTSLSPTAVEFSTSDNSSGNVFQPPQWTNQNAPPESASAYMPPMEPMNYRRLLDKNMNCNWKYIVDKIVCNNDQQASIFLQQKLKISTTEQKYELVEAIIAQAYPLMINRFGNFLVQRCFEHGTPEQVMAIANAIRGNTLNLSMDAFGCHVVQKAFDVVPEDYKAIMVHELLRRIPETVIHRYACHVWQKLFELRWSESPPQIMKYVNEALRGMWHEVALGETGSLVVQNIFENCLEEDKRPCINEVLSSIDIIAHGQFGNWCIQHICEHGLPADKSRAIEHVLRFATEYSTDQFASKVIEKCLKIGGVDFMDRYLERVCEGRPDRPRMPLIDIAGDQYGNYLVQYILIHAGPQHREIVSTHVRKHMVSLRGSKFGSRVAMLCSNPAFATRPGPPVGMQMNGRFMQNMGMNRGPGGPPYR